jgi:predicted metal-binding membrane protein
MSAMSRESRVSVLRSVAVPRTLRVPAALTALALGGWIVSAIAMQGMMAMEGPGSIGSFLWLWVAMSAAMMLPSLVPAASLATRVGRSASGFVSGYAVVWAVTGILGFEAAKTLADAGTWLAVGAIGVAATYRLTPLKSACLTRCRGPLGLLLRRSGVRAGLEHGVICLGCCWALMLAFLALGVASMFWMAVVAAAIFLEKVTSIGGRASAPVALALAGTAIWLAL